MALLAGSPEFRSISTKRRTWLKHTFLISGSAFTACRAIEKLICNKISRRLSSPATKSSLHSPMICMRGEWGVIWLNLKQNHLKAVMIERERPNSSCQHLELVISFRLWLPWRLIIEAVARLIVLHRRDRVVLTRLMPPTAGRPVAVLCSEWKWTDPIPPQKPRNRPPRGIAVELCNPYGEN